jgi:hypothetical protein
MFPLKPVVNELTQITRFTSHFPSRYLCYMASPSLTKAGLQTSFKSLGDAMTMEQHIFKLLLIIEGALKRYNNFKCY